MMLNLPKYDCYKDSGVDWLGKIPEHWEVLRTKNIFRLIAKPAPNNNDYELLSVYTDIGVKPRKELEERGNKASTTDGYWMVKKGDVIVNKLLAWMGAIGISDYDGVTSPAYDILRAYKSIESKFYHYLFRNPICLSKLKQHSKGIMEMRLRLYFDEFGSIKLPFPSLEEQEKIVKFLDRKCEEVERSIELKQRLIELLDEQKSIIINQAVTKGLNPNAPMKDSGIDWLGDIPAHWEVKKLKYLVNNISDKITVKNTNKKYLGLENIESWTGKVIETELITEGIANSFEKNDILFGKLRPYLAKVHLAENSGCCTTEALVLRFKTFCKQKYYFYFLISRRFINLVNSSVYGSKMPRASWDFIGLQIITIPPIEEQEKIVEYLENKTAEIEELKEKTLQQIEKLKEFKQILIAEAVTGKIKV